VAVGRLLQLILAILSSHTLDHLLAQYGYAAVFVVVVVGFAWWTRRHRRRLEREAERAYPGALTS